MPLLKVQLLGPPVVTYAEKACALQRRIQRGLLFYLAYQKDAIDRAGLSLMFWPEADETTSRKRVRETLSKLRAELPDPDLLIVDQQQVGLDRSRLRVDAHEFNQLFTQCNRIANSIPRHLPLPTQTHQMIEEALDKWRTPRFMAGVLMPKSLELDYWLTETGTQLERRRMMLIDRLSDHYAASGDFESAVSLLNTILEEDPNNAAWQMRYLTWLQQLGRRSEALAYSNHLQQQYNESDEPLPEKLLTLTAKVQKQDFPEVKSGNPFWPPPSILQTNYVGRRVELQTLQKAFQRGGIVLLSGESGSGKTRLFHEFSIRNSHNARVLIAPSHPSTQHLPYQPLIEILRHSISEKEWKRVPLTWIAPLSHIMPELNTHLRQPSRLEDTLQDGIQNVIFESMHQVLKVIAGRERLLVFLDDAQYTDQTTLETLAYLVSRGFFEKHGLLVIAASMEEISPALDSFLSVLQKPPARVENITLSEMNIAEASDLVAGVLGHQLPDEAVERLLENTSGQPLYLIETLRAMLDYSPETNFEKVIDHLPLPESIREQIQRKITALSQPALKVLQTAAIADSNVSPALIEIATGMETESVVRALEELECQRLMQTAVSQSKGPYYHFPSNRERIIVLSEISEARKRMIHLSVARAMQALPLESGNSSLIARHYETAGELKAAYDHWVKAGIKAFHMFSRQETRLCFNKAFALLQKLGEFVSEEEIYTLFLNWGDYLDDIAEFKEGQKLYFDLQVLGSQRQSNLLLGTAFNGLCRAYRRLDAYDKSLHYNDLALAHLTPGPIMPEYLYAHNRRAVTLALLGAYEESVAALQKAIELSRNRNERRVHIGLGGVLLQIASIWNFKGMPQRSIDIADLAERSLLANINDPDIEMIRIMRAQAYSLLGFPKKAYRICNEVLEKAWEWNNKRLEAFAKMVKSFACMAIGLMDECLADARDALAIAAQFNYSHITQQTYGVLGSYYRMLGAYDLALKAHRKGLENSTRLFFRLDNEIGVAYNQIQMGAVTEGLAALDSAIRRAEEDEFNYISLTARIMQASALIKLQEINRAESIIEQVIRESEEKGMVILEANITLYAGLCALLKGDTEEAKKHFIDSIETTRENGNVWVENAALDNLFKIYNSQGKDTGEITQRLEEIRTFVLQNAQQPEVRTLVMQAFDRMRIKPQDTDATL